MKVAVAGYPGPTARLETVGGVTVGGIALGSTANTSAVRVTEPLKPLSESTLMLKLAAPGSFIVRKSLLGVRLKPGDGTMTSIRAVLMIVLLAASTRKE